MIYIKHYMSYCICLSLGRWAWWTDGKLFMLHNEYHSLFTLGGLYQSVNTEYQNVTLNRDHLDPEDLGVKLEKLEQLWVQKEK